MASSDELKVPTFLRRKNKKKKASSKTVKKAKPKKKAKVAVVSRKKKAKKVLRPKAKKKQASRIRQLAEQSRPLTRGRETKVLVGLVTHYFDKIKVGIIRVEMPFKKGQTLSFDGDQSFKQKISSMQFNREEIEVAKKGQEIGIKLKKEPKVGDKVYL